MAARFDTETCAEALAAAGGLHDDPPVSFRSGPEDAAPDLPGQAKPWRILVADDDPEVHSATMFALAKVLIDGRSLELLHAHSAAQAEAVLRSETDIAVAMLDVVMETPDAGLQLVALIRDELGLDAMRIVLRTGQPGYAPELKVIQQYDINDYRTKSELSRTRLVTTLTAAVRAYDQIESERAAGRAMDALARSSGTLFQCRDGQSFAGAVLHRLGSVLGGSFDAFVAMEGCASASEAQGMHIQIASGRFSGVEGRLVEQVGDIELIRSVRRVMAARTSVFESGRFTLWIGNGSRDAVVVVDHAEAMRPLQRKLIGIFAETLGVVFENVDLIERLEFFAFCDPLTRLPNRTRFISEVDQDLFAHPGAARSLLIVDVLRFSAYNENLGLRCGDTLLGAIARRLRGMFAPGVLVARIGADAFAIYGPDGEIQPTGIYRAFDAPFFVHGHVVEVRLHIGQVRVADCKGNAVELLRNASLALNAARHSGNGCARCFDESMADALQQRTRMLHGLRASVDFRRGLGLHYQPLVSGRDGRVLAIEVLARWRSESGESVPPAVFIPLAEQSGLINELGRWTMEQAIERLARLRSAGWPELGLVINISGVQLRNADFVSQLAALLEISALPPACITLDLGKDIREETPELLSRQFAALQALGVKLALDDFSPLLAAPEALSGWPIQTLKLALPETPAGSGAEHSLPFVESLRQLARLRGLDFVAKGVEQAEQARALSELGCDGMQGFHFAAPMPGEKLEAWLRQRSH
ncbi:EAL domain-containing protein [Uliginosibacterium paludis]|uniref:EAL domain-containing protein n=1 Tax=Uliginosibacterium paludis TaxID=1615952 RepID=A0ABV2CKS7_9RHOO